MRLCRYLRWKGLYGRHFRDEDELDRALRQNDVPYSCLRTCQPWGPDDAMTVPEHCQPGRSCFTPSPRDPHTAPVS